MTTLITGGAGYIGSHTAHALLDRGDQVVVLDDLSTGSRALVGDEAVFALGDVADTALVARIRRTPGGRGHSFRRIDCRPRVRGGSTRLL